MKMLNYASSSCYYKNYLFTIIYNMARMQTLILINKGKASISKIINLFVHIMQIKFLTQEPIISHVHKHVINAYKYSPDNESVN